jgi:TM2 domain-containing membrane protein YozV
MKRSPAAAVWLSLIPGAGHIYVGQVTKGIVLIVVLGSVIQMVSNGADGFGIVIPFIWLYAMLDAHRGAVEVNRRAAAGRELPYSTDLAPAKWWGYTLIGLGVLFLLESMNLIDFEWIWRFWPLGLIGLGVYVLRRKSEPSPMVAAPSYAPPSPPEPAPENVLATPMTMTDEEHPNG